MTNGAQLIIEVGKLTLTQAGFACRPTTEQTLVPTDISLIASGDEDDVRFDVFAGTDRTTIRPASESGDVVLVVSTAATAPAQRELLYPGKLFRFVDGGHRYPTFWFQPDGASQPTGRFNTALGFLADSYRWSWSDSTGGNVYTFALPADVVVEMVVFEGGTDVVTPVLPGRNITKIVMAKAGGSQQDGGGVPWPPK